MREIIASDPLLSINIGRVGENEAVKVLFPVVDKWTERYGSGTFELVAKRPGDAAGYPALVTVSGNNVEWLINSSDVAKAGEGKAQLSLIVGDTVAKSLIFSTRITPTIDASPTPPPPYQSWVDDVIAAGAEAIEAAGAAEEAREAIENLGADATTTEAGSGATVDKEIDPETGAVTLHFGIPAGLVEFLRFEYDAETGQIIAVYPRSNEDYQFFYNESTGELEVEIA